MSLPPLDVMHYSDRSVDVRSKGAIGDIALWDRSLAVSEVRKLALSRRKSASRLYRQISKPSTTELDNSDAPSLFFPFQEGKGSEISDVGPRKMLLHLRGVNPATWIERFIFKIETQQSRFFETPNGSAKDGRGARRSCGPDARQTCKRS